jgi:UDP-glucose 4-epimerase
MKYLVTGGAGFIGSHLVDALIRNGSEVVVLDNLSSGYRENLSGKWGEITFILGDIRDAATCAKAAAGCDGIFHEAALVSVPESISRPLDNHDINVTGTVNVLEAARKQGVKRVVFASSAAVYGDSLELPKLEDMLPRPKSPYALAKLTGEYYLRVYAECYGLETVALRYFNVFGLRQDPSSMYSGVISIFSERVKKGLPITIYGDGLQTRDFIHIENVVQANLAAMGRPVPASPAGELPGGKFARAAIYNIAAGQQTSVLQMLAMIETVCGKKAALKFAGTRAGDIRHSYADISKAEEILQYKVHISLQEGLEELIGLTKH